MQRKTNNQEHRMYIKLVSLMITVYPCLLFTGKYRNQYKKLFLHGTMGPSHCICLVDVLYINLYVYQSSPQPRGGGYGATRPPNFKNSYSFVPQKTFDLIYDFNIIILIFSKKGENICKFHQMIGKWADFTLLLCKLEGRC